MERQDVGILMDLLKIAYPTYYRGLSLKEQQAAVNLWAEMFRDEPAQLVAASVKSLIESDEKGFPPTIGQVKAKLRLLTGPREMTEMEAWALVSKAVCNSLYGSEEEFSKLPPDVQRAVGNPAVLREWAMLDVGELQTVVSSNFQRSYRAVAARTRELAKLPADVRAMLGELSAAMALPEAKTPPKHAGEMP